MTKYSTALLFLFTTSATVLRSSQAGPIVKEFQDVSEHNIQVGSQVVLSESSSSSSQTASASISVNGANIISSNANDKKDKQEEAAMYAKFLREGINRQIPSVVSTILVESPSAVHHRDENGWTNLHQAARLGNLELVKMLHEEGGADVTARHRDGQTALDVAREYLNSGDQEDEVEDGGDHEVVVYLEGAIKEDERGYGELFTEAILRENTEVLSSILEQRPDIVHVRDENGWTKLHEAARLGNFGVVRHIVENSNADVNAKHGRDGKGDSVLEVAKKYLGSDDHKVVVYLDHAIEEQKDKQYHDVLRTAVNQQNAEVVANVLNDRPNVVHHEDENGWTSLHQAARLGNLEIVMMLHKKGESNILARHKMGHTALDVATEFLDSEDHEVVVYLKDAMTQDENAYSELFLEGIKSENTEVLSSILEQRPEIIHTRDENGWTKLHEAARLGNLDVVRHIVENSNADVNAKHGRDGKGDSVLEVAKKYLGSDDHKVVVYLESAIEEEADKYYDMILREAIKRQNDKVLTRVLEDRPNVVHHKDENGWTGLHEAVRFGNISATKLLVEEGSADINVRNGNSGRGGTVLDVAIEYLQSADHEIVQYLKGLGSLTSDEVIASEF